MSWAAPDDIRIAAALQATWPPAETRPLGGWVLRNGADGGQRVSSALVAGDPGMALEEAIEQAEAGMRSWGQRPLFHIWPTDTGVDAALAARGYAIKDPVTCYAAPVDDLAALDHGGILVAKVATPLAVMDEIWAAGGVGPSRLAVMDRAAGPSMKFFARVADDPAGAAFTAVDGDIAMIHAIETLTDKRRLGVGRALMRAAAGFARSAGASTLALAVTQANEPANALYRKIGMQAVCSYHYRVFQEDDA